MTLKRLSFIALFALLIMNACVPTVTTDSAPTSIAGEYLTSEYTDATNLRNQLAFGTMQLDGTVNTVTPEQAKELIQLWQAIIALSGDSTTASEELTAVQDQIVTTLTPEQLQYIAAMQITNADLSAFYAEYGVALSTPVPSVTKVPGSGSGKTEEEKAAARATAEASGQATGTGQAARTLLFEKVVEYLMKVAG